MCLRRPSSEPGLGAIFLMPLLSSSESTNVSPPHLFFTGDVDFELDDVSVFGDDDAKRVVAIVPWLC